MDIVILNKSDKPIYEQLYEQLASQILCGEIAAGFCLPSIRTLAKELNISIITVKKSYEMLEEKELIYTRAGKGCFVSEHVEKYLHEKKLALATAQIKKDVQYYKNLNISLEEFINIVKKEY